MLVEWKDNHLANTGLVRKQHDHPVDSRSASSMRRSSERESVDHPGKFFIDNRAIISSDFERLIKSLRLMVSDGSAGQFDAIADNIVLVGLDRQDPASAAPPARPAAWRRGYAKIEFFPRRPFRTWGNR